uniref:Uncharacterized protein n=1 Tax=Anopheles maculatus TaxID=74869 RepID=A0A182SC95_9DIPT
MQLHRYFCVLDQTPDSILPYYSNCRNSITSEKGQQEEDENEQQEEEEEEEQESDESNLNLTDQLHNTNRNSSNNTIPNYLYTSVGKPLARCTWKILVQDNVGGSSGFCWTDTAE